MTLRKRLTNEISSENILTDIVSLEIFSTITSNGIEIMRVNGTCKNSKFDEKMERMETLANPEMMNWPMNAAKSPNLERIEFIW